MGHAHWLTLPLSKIRAAGSGPTESAQNVLLDGISEPVTCALLSMTTAEPGHPRVSANSATTAMLFNRTSVPEISINFHHRTIVFALSGKTESV